MSQPNNAPRTLIASLVVAASTLVGIAMNEGYVGQAKPDSGGVQTIGFGETVGVKAGDKTDPVRALVKLESSVNVYANGVKSCINVPLYQYEFDAYVDLAYNTGVNGFCQSPVSEKANAGDYFGACEAMLAWRVHDRQGHLIQGLINRRMKEYKKCKGEQP
jgi:lysozyme